MIYWFTGQPGAGKTTLAKALIEKCSNNCVHVDGDGLRDLFQNFDYSEEGRRKNIQSVLDLCRFLDSKGFCVVVSVVAPYKEMRESLKSTNKVTEIYVHTTELRGRENYFAKDYEPPTDDFISIDTTDMSVEDCLDMIPFSRKVVDDLDKRKTIAIDFDGVIHRYSKGFQGLDNIYDLPSDGCFEALENLKRDGYTLKILSSRPKEIIKKWLVENKMDHFFDDVSNHKFPATIYIDDRGYHFKSWETTLKEIYSHPKIKK